MKESTISVKVTRTVVDGIKEARDLQDWCLGQDGLYCNITARIDGEWFIEVGGDLVHSHIVEFGDTVSWDGAQFTVTKAAL